MRVIRFEVLHQSGRARTGRLETTHGAVETPVFMPVGTKAAVKSLLPSQLEVAGVEMILSNTYHLALRPGEELVAKMGGLHRFMAWPRPILTDSGGYQVFSLARLRKVNDEGVEFQSHLDGSLVSLTPERAVEIQRRLGADVIMPLDEPAPWPCDGARVEKAMQRTHAWLTRCKRAWAGDGPQALFGIVQGGMDARLRRASAEAVCAHDLPGYAIGGLSLGEPAELLYEITDVTAALLPVNKPRYLMGVGTPADIARSVALGIDMFDCVLPTRLGRNGWAFTSEGMIKIRNAEWKEDARPVDPNCSCPCCAAFSRAYLRHCFNVDEIVGLAMLSLHNIHYYVGLMRRLRAAIREGTLEDVVRQESQRCPPLTGRREEELAPRE
ncbi:MAG: tRNA guanosine(34) transglycosylase Tgt [Planctomycetes bacterium]|nr:tRNA guanosine(34) transglycosylase Tgt [Planctomycetota bacterium]